MRTTAAARPVASSQAVRDAVRVVVPIRLSGVLVPKNAPVAGRAGPVDDSGTAMWVLVEAVGAGAFDSAGKAVTRLSPMVIMARAVERRTRSLRVIRSVSPENRLSQARSLPTTSRPTG